MRILYAIQGTGNGHISRARDIIPYLQEKGVVDLLISGIQSDVDLPYEIKYQLKGLSFIFGKKGGIDLLDTYRKSNLKRLYQEIQSLPIEDYDLVISDFEPVSSWACKLKNKPCIGLSHQSAVINKKSPKPNKTDMVGKAVLNNYAPVDISYGFHFKQYDKQIFTPVIRNQIRQAKPEDAGHYTVYLPAYNDERLLKVLTQIPLVKWQVFSKHTKKEYKVRNVHIQPINNELFVQSMVSCTGMLCGAGFETPAEALFLKKKLMVIPMKGQYEQHCNAAALKEMGVPVIKSLKKKHIGSIEQWIRLEKNIVVDFPNQTEQIINTLINENYQKSRVSIKVLGQRINTWKQFKHRSFGNILKQLTD
ncbi:MAG: glycosyl transferase [Chitinophagaceae bacterium BSSC1]|nr:MAG: glycosyl transferase [Chitinophagaceae bacterium BSSC1]